MKRHERRPATLGRIFAFPLVVAVLAATLMSSAPARAATIPRLQMRWLTNHSRTEREVPRLRLNPRLSAIAARHSRAMALRESLFHTSNVPGELRRWKWSRWGENVGMTNQSLPTLEWAFMNSIDHRTNILDERFSRVGIGVARVNGMYWVTVIFYG
jgi:uncharacterized protein YkwD